jgi:hypothetical protein
LGIVVPSPIGAQHGTALRTMPLSATSTPISCLPGWFTDFNRAAAFTLSGTKSEETFLPLQSDPSCGIAEWGVAMSHYRQLWDPPTSRSASGIRRLEKQKPQARENAARTRLHIASVDIFYEDSDEAPRTPSRLDLTKNRYTRFTSIIRKTSKPPSSRVGCRANALYRRQNLRNQKKPAPSSNRCLQNIPSIPGLLITSSTG